MAQDYHIYLHGVEGGQSLGDKTKPFSTTKSDSDSPFLNAVSGIQKGIGIAKNPIGTGVSALSKVVPYVAAAMVIGGIVDKVLTTGFAHQEEYTGNYANNVRYNNIKNAIGVVLNPIGAALKQARQHFQFKKQSEQIEEQNRLLGTSIYKDFRIGV